MKLKVKKNQISSNESWRLCEQSCDGLISSSCISWRSSNVSGLSSAQSFMRMRRWSVPCRTAQFLFERTGSKQVVGFPSSQMGCLSCALPCRKPCRKHTKFWAICHVAGSPPAVKAVRCMWCSHGTAKLGLQGFLLNHITDSTTCRRQLFVSQITKISHILP